MLELLFQVRVNSGLRQADLALKLGFPQSFISKIENGERRIDIIELIDICEALNVDIKEFIEKLQTKIALSS